MRNKNRVVKAIEDLCGKESFVLKNPHAIMKCLFKFQARADILKIHSRKMNLTRGINLRKIAEMMPGASGAEVKVRIEHINVGHAHGLHFT